ncbi:hypothetical protein IGI04_027473 [Brassica rapa subsp. trilocularis]|uniref:Uncharacterized protein n=1 Tax=Brassica rapa subsp. trilocularis TaxID=1813537 RepID=A0ABQ7L1I0_BRACM|nr:hypothetical protein IGI04_027473 [Brassica rapa subsp. trilocularis]
MKKTVVCGLIRRRPAGRPAVWPAKSTRDRPAVTRSTTNPLWYGTERDGRSCGACLGVPADTYARVCLENEQELPGSDGTQRREDLLGILPTRPQSRLYHVTDPSEFLQ